MEMEADQHFLFGHPRRMDCEYMLEAQRTGDSEGLLIQFRESDSASFLRKTYTRGAQGTNGVLLVCGSDYEKLCGPGRCVAIPNEARTPQLPIEGATMIKKKAYVDLANRNQRDSI